MKHTIIPKGYRLTVTSWENDADNYNTKSIDSLSKEDVAFLVDLIKLMRSQNARPNPGFGNMYDPGADELAKFHSAVNEVIEKHDLSKTKYAEMETDVEDEDDYADYVMSILNDVGLSCGEFYTRVMESFKVEFIPEDIKIQDVSAEFY